MTLTRFSICRDTFHDFGFGQGVVAGFRALVDSLDDFVVDGEAPVFQPEEYV